MTCKKSLGTVLSLIATVIILLAFGGMTVLADETENPTENPEPTIVASGYCGAEENGENISWELDSNGLLTVSGTGKMQILSYSDSPWKKDNRIREATISYGITNIGSFAFYGCTELTSITIPDSVTVIEGCAFDSCTGLTSITIPDSVTSIGLGAFCRCTGLTSITIPDSVTDIEISAFQGCTGLTSITIPDSVTSICVSAFENCTGLTSITIPDSVTSISDETFEGCTGLTSITIPDSVTSIGYSAFGNCTGLSSITIPDSVTSFEPRVFKGCTGLTSITIPDSVKSISYEAFHGCAGLTSITIPDSVTDIENSAFQGCTGLTSITIPGSVTGIGTSTFEGCTGLTSIAIPDSVKSISYEAFQGCTGLTSITIPDSVTSIGRTAFGDCNNINSLILSVNPNVFETELRDFFPTSITANVYVPVKYGSAYALLFSEFSNINLIDSNGTIILNRDIRLKGYSLSLDGSIGVNFRMHLSSKELEKPENSYMRFTVNGNVQKVYVKDAELKDGQYYFRCDVTAKEMADEITAQFYYDDDTPAEMTYKYSVREYAGYIINHPNEYSKETIMLVEAMLNYGASSQVYFNHNTDNLANSILDDGQQHTSYSGMPTFTDKGDISPAKVSLVLNSTLTLKLYLKNEDVADITSFQYGSKTLTPTVSGDYTIISIEGLKATQFNRVLNIRCYTNGSTSYKSIRYSPANYAYIVINSDNGGVITNELNSVVYALYQFSRAALEYNDSQAGQTDPSGT